MTLERLLARIFAAKHDDWLWHYSGTVGRLASNRPCGHVITYSREVILKADLDVSMGWIDSEELEPVPDWLGSYPIKRVNRTEVHVLYRGRVVHQFQMLRLSFTSDEGAETYVPDAHPSCPDSDDRYVVMESVADFGRYFYDLTRTSDGDQMPERLHQLLWRSRVRVSPDA